MLKKAALLGLLALLPATALAADKSDSELYQQKLIEDTLVEQKLAIEPFPDGKIIERILVASYDVVLANEPWPEFLNHLHTTTAPHVIRRELLFKEGDRWEGDHVLESARNLRNYLFLNVARIIPCKGSDSEHVVVLVVSKDLWSLRLNTDFSYVGSKLERLQLEVAEHNFIGRNKTVTADFGMDLASAYVGQQYLDPRVFLGDLRLQERADVIWNRSSGALEGGVFNFSVERPLFTLDTKWSWTASSAYRRDIYRYFSGGELDQVVSPTTGESLPFQYKREQLDLVFGVTRSFGREFKRNVSFGYRAIVRDYEIPAPQSAVQPATLADFTTSVLPRTESAGMLFVSARAFRADFLQLIDIDTFALTEDYRIGPDLTAELRYASRAFGFSSSFIEPTLTANYTWYESQDLFTLGAGLDVRYQPEISQTSDWVNGDGSLRMRNVSPTLSFFKVVTRGNFIRRFNNLRRTFNTLGGDGSLRGYPSGYFRGANLWSANFEARTEPFVLATMHAGMVAFVDMGGASDQIDAMGVHGSAGFGFRILFPQFDREVLRVDIGFPFEPIVGASPAYVVAQFGQAF